MQKLKIIKQNLIQWNKTKFGKIFSIKAEIESDQAKVNLEVKKRGMDECICLKEKDLKLRLEDILDKDEIFWKQTSRETWLKEGDKNTNFFHNSTKIKRANNKIS